jgi:predicted tellurium resistance membrane protein TerC
MHQAVNVFALSFLLLIGRTGRRRFGMHIPKGYIYFAIRFSVRAEMVSRPFISSPPVTIDSSQLFSLEGFFRCH